MSEGKHSRPEKGEFCQVQQCEVEGSELESGINGPSANRCHSLFHQQGWKDNGEF